MQTGNVEAGSKAGTLSLPGGKTVLMCVVDADGAPTVHRAGAESESAVAGDAGLKTFKVADILRPGLPLTPYGMHTFDALHGPISPAATTALHVLHATLAGALPGAVSQDLTHRNRLAAAVYTLARQYAALAKAINFESASSAARARALVVEAAQVLDALGSQLSRNSMFALLDTAQYAVLSAMANRPSVVTKAVETLVDLTATRFSQTAGWLGGARGESWESQERTRAYENFNGPLHFVSAYRRNQHYPFDELPLGALAFLGTEAGPTLKQGIVDFVLKADKGLGLLIELHAARFISGKPAGEAKPPMGAQGDLERLLVGLAHFKRDDSTGYSAARAFAQTAAIYDAVLEKAESPAMHRLVTDCALTALDLYAHGKVRSAEADEAARELVARLRRRGPDEITNARIGRLLTARAQAR
ncbi:MAG: hypothetical protein ACAI38_02500 [Myxococcota bacterium]